MPIIPSAQANIVEEEIESRMLVNPILKLIQIIKIWIFMYLGFCIFRLIEGYSFSSIPYMGWRLFIYFHTEWIEWLFRRYGLSYETFFLFICITLSYFMAIIMVQISQNLKPSLLYYLIGAIIFGTLIYLYYFIFFPEQDLYYFN
jgi:hypothetical protein